MTEARSAILESWSIGPWLAAGTVIVAAIYFRGWRALHRRMPGRFTTWRLASFLAGLVVLFTAVASPLDAFSNLLLQVHMIQHLLLMLVVPPLLLLGWPAIPMLRGLHPTFREQWIGPFLRSPGLRRLWRRLTHPVFGWWAFALCFWIWHVPALYELALRSPGWHRAEHAMFVATAILFWWPVVEPYPFALQWPRWTMIPYLLLASLQNTVFSAIFAFSDRVFYPVYEQVPRIVNMTPLQDQAAAGAVMWVPGSIIMLVPVAWITRSLMTSPALRHASRVSRPARRAPHQPFDLLRIPGIGALLGRRWFRQSLRALMLIVAVVIVVDGLRGPRMASMNLAGVLPWTHWRGLVVITLLVGANFFCMVCPFMLPRSIGRKIFAANRPWPRALRSKWLAVGLVAAYLCVYEVFDPWASPWWTAWIIVGYFVAAFAVDGIFRGASFCKYVCPIGQFHFVQSMVSPLEVKVRDHAVCAGCRTHDCIKGNDNAPGCETHLFQPRKIGSLDCTVCLDCVSACPHDNVGILAAVPGTDLVHEHRRSSLRRLSRRPDVAALIAVLVFGAFVNAAGMVGPVVRWQDRLSEMLGVPRQVVTAVLLVIFLLVLPAAVIGVVADLSRRWGRVGTPWRESACRFVVTLVPMGFAMWFTHMFFHFVTSAGTIVPVTQRFLRDVGITWLGEPAWSMSMSSPSWLVPLEITTLGLGLVFSVAAIWLVAVHIGTRAGRSLRLALPWGLLATTLYAAGIWIIFQPMEMRGTMIMG